MSSPVEPRRMLAIGGSDSCGGAGIQADIKTGSALGVDVCTAITAITAQNSLGVHAVEPVSLELLEAQLAAVCSDVRPHAVKLGMLCDSARVRVVGHAIRAYGLHNVVCDPVLLSTSGATLLDEPGSILLIAMLPLFTLFTPNAMEAATLTGTYVETEADLLKAGRILLECGANAVLLKGGHLVGADSTDILIQQRRPDPIAFTAPRVETRNDHGTGCVLASAIAAALACGLELVHAVERGCATTHAALRRSANFENGSGRGSMLLFEPNTLQRC